MLIFYAFSHKPYLNSRVHVIIDIVVLQDTMAIVIKVNSNLVNKIRVISDTVDKAFICDVLKTRIRCDIVLHFLLPISNY